MAHRYILQLGQGFAKRPNRQYRYGAFISLPQANATPVYTPTQASDSKGADARVDFVVDLDVRHSSANDGKRGSGAC